VSIAPSAQITIEDAERIAADIVDSHSAPLSSALPAASAAGYENLSMLSFSVVVTIVVSSLAATVSCVRATEQHAMSFIALGVCAGTAAYVLFVRATASSGVSTAAQRDQSVLRRLGLGAMAVGVVLALLAMLAPDTVFDFSLRRGLNEAAEQTATFMALLLDSGDGADRATKPWLPFTLLVIAVLCGAGTFVQLVPALFYSRSLAMQLRDEATSQWKQGALLVSFAAPLLLAALWVRPVVGDSILPPDLVKCNATSLARDCTIVPHAGEFFLTETQWLSARIGLVILYCAAHLPVVRWHIEAHLRRARNDQVRTMVEYVSVRKESLRPGLDIMAELKSQAAEPFMSLNVVASSLVAPFVVLLMLALAAARKGELTPLSPCPAVHAGLHAIGIHPDAVAADPERAGAMSEVDALLMAALARVFPNLPATRSLTIISPSLWRPVLSVLIWYLLASWFVLTAVALAYWQLVLGSAKLKLQDNAAPVNDEAEEDADAGKRKKTGPKKKRKPATKAKQA